MVVDSWEQWLGRHGYAPPYRWTALAGGMNNQAYRVETGTQIICLKHYRSPQRLEREFWILSLLAPTGWTPQPFLQSSQLQLGVYEFLEGAPVAPTCSDCHQAFEFLESMQPLRKHRLPPASDACLEPARHWEEVQARVSDVDDVFSSDWKRDWQPFFEQTARLAPASAAEESELIVSPSDFGFHNSLRQADGRLRFFDLEYAGMDDPAKVVCDFFAQPRLPAPLESLSLFLESLPARARTRLAWMWPVTVAKWACIILKQRKAIDPDQQWKRAQWLLRRHSEVADRLEGSLGLPVNGPQGE